MKVLGILAFGAFALLAASFASTAPARADNVGIYVGSDGFGIQVSNYDERYGHGSYHRQRGCWDPYYHRYVRCGYAYNYPPHHNNYDGDYHGPRWRHGHRWDRHRYHDRGWGHHRRHHGDRHHGRRGRGHHGGRGD